MIFWYNSHGVKKEKLSLMKELQQVTFLLVYMRLSSAATPPTSAPHNSNCFSCLGTQSYFQDELTNTMPSDQHTCGVELTAHLLRQQLVLTPTWAT